MGVLLATGLIVGDSLTNVGFAGIVAATGSGSPIALVGDDFLPAAEIGGVVVFGALLWALYRYTRRLAASPATPPASG
jgi:hypothetical protein